MTLFPYTTLFRSPEEMTASRRVHLHFLHRPAEVLGKDSVTGLRTERTQLNGDGTVSGTGEFHDWDVQAVYRAVGYFGSPLADLPFDEVAGVMPNVAGRGVAQEIGRASWREGAGGGGGGERVN